MECTIDRKDYREGGSVYRRTAARGILRRGNQFLLVTTHRGEYKFPGGGLEEGETLEEALVREVREETGYAVQKSSIQKYGVVKEFRKGTTADILEMDSHYFLCEADGSAGEQALDRYEEQDGFRAVWVPLEEALQKNRTLFGCRECPWVERDSRVMECLLEDTAPKLVSRRAVIDFCKGLGDVVEDYPFQDSNWTVMRHRDNQKGFAFLYERGGGLQVNVKCSPEWTSFWRGTFEAVTPGYHMNKTHWNTILLNGSVPDGDVKAMIAESYRLTDQASRRKAQKERVS